MDKEIIVKLPCKIGDTVYTISLDDFSCEACEHGEEVHYNVMECVELKKDCKCPPPHFSIEEHICEGFMISCDKNGTPVVSRPGEWGCEGLEQFCGCDDKVYYSYEDAQNALKKLKKSAVEKSL